MIQVKQLHNFGLNSDSEDSADEDSDSELQELFKSGKLDGTLVREEDAPKNFIVNKAGLKQVLSDIETKKLGWFERLDINVNLEKFIDGPSKDNLAMLENSLTEDDFKREYMMEQQACIAAKEALIKLTKLKVPIKRPNDFFAEMIKSDEQMKSIKNKLVQRKAMVEKVAKIRKMREAKKFGKQVQQEMVAKRRNEKKDMLSALKKFRQKSTSDTVEDEDVNKKKIENILKGKSVPDQQKPSKKREYRNKKFGFGGQKKRSKSNDAMSSAKVTDFRKRKKDKIQSKPGPKSKQPKKQRLGKNRRHQMKNKKSKR